MGSLTETARNELLDHIYNAAYTPVSTIYLALYIGDPAGAGSEATGNGYARESIAFASASSRRSTQTGIVSFPQASGAWGGTITHYALYSAITSGVMLATGLFSDSFAVVAGNTPKINSGCYVEISTNSGSGFTTTTVNKLLDLMFKNTAYSTPNATIHLALATAVLSDASTTSFTEASGTSYARKDISALIGNASSGAVTNTGAITFATPGATWGTITSIATMDASSSGNILAYDNSNVVDQTVNSDDTVEIATGEYDHALT
jgi:hypothetical protein